MLALSYVATVKAAVTYQVTFEATWSASTHPTAYPANAHFSPLVGGVHTANVAFWAVGEIASDGIEQMAETGGTSILRGEVEAAIDAATASAVISGAGVDSPGSVSTTFEVSTEYPLVTLVTMVAPSPDWFVGVHDLDLRQGGGWIDELTVELAGYDAGTDSGLDFTSANADTMPREPIALLGAPFSTTGPLLGRYTFTRLTSEPLPGDYNGNGVVDAADYTVWRDHLDQEFALPNKDPANLDGIVTQADYDFWKSHFGDSSGSGSAASAAFPLPPSTLATAVPEPAIGMSLFAAAALLVGVRWRP
jgi:hypothetical protein